MQEVFHTIPPVFDRHSKILILGTMPSPKSRESGFFYMHPQNRFWRVLADVLNCTFPATIEDKKQMLLQHRIALWDVLQYCHIDKASDASIRNPLANDIPSLLTHTDIWQIFATGKTAKKLYDKLCYSHTNIPCIALPSTSPANCRVPYPELKQHYRIILEYLS